MSDLDRFLAWIMRNPIWAASIVAWIVLTVRSKLKEAADAKGTKGPRAARGPDPTAREGESDLEARVRRNFEEMLRRRRAASEPAAPSPVPVAAPAATQRAPRHAHVDYDEAVRPEPTSTEPTRSATPRPEVVVARKAKVASRHLEAAAHAVKGTVRSADSSRVAKRARSQELRRVILQPSTLRRAILLREILDPPIALK